jgi:hypothetical protein
LGDLLRFDIADDRRLRDEAEQQVKKGFGEMLAGTVTGARPRCDEAACNA